MARRPNLSYANVVSSIALFIALGGVSWAAVKLPRNSVGTPQIKADAVTGAKVKNGSLTDRDLAPGTVLQGKTGEIGRPGPKGDAGPAGPAGPQGQQGQQGIQGIQGIQGVQGPPGGSHFFKAFPGTAGQETAPGTTLVNLDAEAFDPWEVFDQEAKAYTAPEDGFYAFTGRVHVETDGVARLSPVLYSGKGLPLCRGAEIVNRAAGRVGLTFSCMQALAAGESVSLMLEWATGDATRAVINGGDAPPLKTELAGWRLGDLPG